MTTITDLIPRLRWHRTGRVIAVRCTACRVWRKPNRFNRRSNICQPCTYGVARRLLLDQAVAGKHVTKHPAKAY